MTVQPTLEYRSAGSDGPWTRMDPAKREQWQWDDAPDWLAAEALWLMGEGCEVRLVTAGKNVEAYGDHTEDACLSLNPPGDNPAVPEGATRYDEPVANAGQQNDPGTGAYHHTTDVRRLAETPAPVMVRGYTTDQLRAAWDLVRPSGDWKGPIDAIVAEDADLSAIAAACLFYAGTEAVIVRTKGGHRVTGTGYYVNIGS